MTEKQKKTLARIITASVIILVAIVLPAPDVVKNCLYLGAYFLVGYDILRKAFIGIKNRQVFDENFLMAVASVGALLMGEFTEGAAVMLFYQIGEWFQSYAVGRSRKNISRLMDIRPDYANIRGDDGELIQVDPDEVEIGTVITVTPGEKVPIDGVVIDGYSSLDTVRLTGESLPRDIGPGDEIISGCINMTSVLKIRTTKEFGESTVSKILDMVENASSRKSRSEAFISKFARYYTPIVCYSALALAFVPPVILALTGSDPQLKVWVYRRLSFLVTSCPCALVISIPLTFFAGIGGASNAGILVKGSNYLEALAKTEYAVFDKTGTLTKGVFEVSDAESANGDKERLIEIAALAESFSPHPISRSLQRARNGPLDKTRVEGAEEISGYGVKASVDGSTVLAGNAKLMNKFSVAFTPVTKPGTVVYVAEDGIYSGYILISDKAKTGAKEALEKLRDAGVKKTYMLTGDNEATARRIAGELGIDEYYAGLLPGDKVDKVEEIISAKDSKETLVFVGDGINDAPVLSRADVGIAMGALGSDAAIEAADIVLMDDDPMKIPKAIKIAKKCMGIVWRNIYFAIGVKLLCLVLVALGYANMWMAIFSDVGVMILAVFNAIRALNVKNL